MTKRNEQSIANTITRSESLREAKRNLWSSLHQIEEWRELTDNETYLMYLLAIDDQIHEIIQRSK